MLSWEYLQWKKAISGLIFLWYHNTISQNSSCGYFCYIWHVFEALIFLWYHFSIRANPFREVCPFDFYGICNEQESDSACVYGKISQIWHTRPIYFETDKWTTSLKDRLMLATRSLLITSSLFMPPQYEQKISVLTHKAHFKYTLLSRQQVLIFLFFLKFFQF